MARPSSLYVISIGAHLAVGLTIAAIPAKKALETYQVMVSSQRKKVEPPKVDATPKPQAAKERPRAAATPRRLMAAAAQTPAVTQANPAPAGYVPDFGVSMGNFGPNDGIAVPVAAARNMEAPPVPPIKKALVARHAASTSSSCREPIAKARVLHVQRPIYGEAARIAGITGKVRLRIEIDAHGRVTDVSVIEGLGYGLDEAAMTAARALEFAPATQCGKPVASIFKFAVRFGA